MIICGRGLSEGKAEGHMLVSSSPISFESGIEKDTGRIIDRDNSLFGQSVKDKVFGFPRCAGNESVANALHSLIKNGCAPRAFVMKECDSPLQTAIAQAKIPLVDEIDLTLLRNDDEVVVEGIEGYVEVRNVKVQPVVTSFLRHSDKILILKRSDKVLTSKLKWAGVSGYVEVGETPDQTAIKEIREETGVENPVLITRGEPVYVRGKGVFYEIHVFLFEVDTEEIVIDWEHTEYKWINPEEIGNYDTVQKLPEALQRVLD